MGGEDRWGEGSAGLRASLGRLDGWTVTRLAGQIDILTAPGLRGHLDDLVADHGGRPRVVIDLGDVTFCDASGLGVLIGAHHAAARRGGAVRLVVPLGQVRTVLRVANPTHDLEMHYTLNDAVTLGPA